MKQFTKRILLVIAFLFIALVSTGQNIVNPEFDDPNFLYKVGEFNKVIPTTYGSKVHIIGYVRRMSIYTKKEYTQQQEEKILFEPKKFRYELVLISKSTYQDSETVTWVYGVNILINNSDITVADYPADDYNLLIKTTPTVLYWRETSAEMVLMEVSWNNAIYDPRKVK